MSCNSILSISGLVAVLLLDSVAISSQAAEVPDNLLCDQLGREIALRAAEQMSTSISTTNRSELAEIARQACLDYRVMPASPVSGAQSMSPASAAVSPDTTPAAAAAPRAEPEEEGLFDIEIISPQDRVRRPGLKRR